MPNATDLKPADALRKRAKEERQLLRAEQEAERKLLDANERLATAEARLEKAQSRVERRRTRVAKALEELRARQEARASGLDGPSPAAVSAERSPDPQPTPTPEPDNEPVVSVTELVASPSGPTDGVTPPRRRTRRRTADPAIPS